MWALPMTVLGVVLGLLSLRLPRWEGGVLAFDGGARGFLWLFVRLSPYRAITFGHAILSAPPLEGRLLRHERHHVLQYEILGPLFLPTYVALWLLGGYRRHLFEVAAEEAAARADPPG